MSGAESLLRVDGLCSGYGALQVLFEVSFDVRPGEVVALMGSNGAGKTTALKTITGQLKVLRGTVHLDGDDVSGAPAEQLVRRGVAMVPEGRGMLRDLTVAQNLELGAYVVNDRAVVAQALDRAYTAFPILAERREQKAGTLSGGQQQMLSVARALMSGPRLLLVDEASLGLSPALTQTVFSVVDRINDDGVTVVLVEQNVGVLPYADRALIMEKGTLVYQGSGDEIHSGSLRETYLGTPA